MDERIKPLSEIMVPIEEYPLVREDESVNDAIVALRTHLARDRGHRSLLVVRESDVEQDPIVGILTISDIMRSVKEMTRYYDFDEVSKMAHSLNGYGRKVRLYRDKLLKNGYDIRVREIMSRKCVVRVDADVTGSNAAKRMLTKNVEAIIVVSEGRSIGVIRAIDVLDYISSFLAN